MVVCHNTILILIIRRNSHTENIKYIKAESSKQYLETIITHDWRILILNSSVRGTDI